MLPQPRPKLSIPKVLAASVVLACTRTDGDDSATASTTTSTATTATSTTSMTTTSSTDTATTTGDDPNATSSTATSHGDTTETADASSSDTTDATDGDPGDMPDCQSFMNERECNAEPLCFWEKFGACFDNCEALPDMASCLEGLGCNWIDGACAGPF